MHVKHQILELRSQGKTYKAIQDELGCSRSVISYHCQKLPNHEAVKARNIEVRKESRRKFPKTHISPLSTHQHAVIRRLRLEGIRSKEIAEAMKLDLCDVEFVCEKILSHIPRTPELTSYERVKRRRKRLKKLALVYKGGVCEKCGYRECEAALEFHHRDPEEKVKGISALSGWGEVRSELGKCDLLCANCHKETHMGLESKLKFPPWRVQRWKLKSRAILEKGGGCQRCGYNRCSQALVFHHRDPSEKDSNVSLLKGWGKVASEILKCDLLCANCHRQAHEAMK